MENLKYFEDIKKFPTQFGEGIEMARNIKVDGKFNKVIVCGMGGSSLHVDIINDILAEAKETFRLGAHRSYGLPSEYTNETLLMIASNSGNTEEVLSCLEEAKKVGASYIVFSAGGKLTEHAQADGSAYFKLPGGIQPRLTTGYYIGGTLQILKNQGFIGGKAFELIGNMNLDADLELAKSIAAKMKGKVPVVYACDNNSSIARVIKIKFNENSKSQSFAYYFPEMNHNEMQGYGNMVMNPFFFILKSKFTHERNHKRIDVFAKLMSEKGCEVYVLEMIGESTTEELFNAYYFADFLTYYLALEYGTDPEAVPLVEEFKKLI